MARLLIHVEGQTEETFVTELLRPHLLGCGYWDVSPRIMGNARQRNRRGGIKPWPAVRDDILKHFKQDPKCLQSTLVDYYALPQDGLKAWPGRLDAGRLLFSDKARLIEHSLTEDIQQHMGPDFSALRFIPFIAMHEFEGLLFSDCERFASGIGRPQLAANLQAIRDQFNTPEEINDSPLTAPSKRIEVLIPGYQKPLLGGLAALEIGLDCIRQQCPHFRGWLEGLEAWPAKMVTP